MQDIVSSFVYFLESRNTAEMKSVKDYMKEVITPSLLKEMRETATPFGFTLEQAIITDIHGKPTNLIIGDAYAYKTFAKVFDPIFFPEHFVPTFDRDDKYPFSFDATKLSGNCTLNPDFVRSVHIMAARSLKEHRFLPCCELEEKIEIQRAVVRALEHLPNEFKGSYFPILNNVDKTGLLRSQLGFIWPEHEEFHRRMESDLVRKSFSQYGFMRDISPVILSLRPLPRLYEITGVNKDWPSGRGVFVSEAHHALVTINRDDHIRIYHSKHGGDIAGTFAEFCQIYRGIQQGLMRDGLHFAYDEKYGFVNWNTNLVGSAMHLHVRVRMPLLQQRERFKTLLYECSMKYIPTAEEDGCIHLSYRPSFGQDEVEMIEMMSYGLRRMMKLEVMLQNGESIEWDMPSKYTQWKMNCRGEV